jgi:ATP-dependent exoDNAse (exonuclease V) alpha subunit
VPFAEQKVANGELGTITKIDHNRIYVALDDERRISFDTHRFPHIDHGYAVTSYSSQGLTVDRVLLNADTRESMQLLNDRMAYVALSRARMHLLTQTGVGNGKVVQFQNWTDTKVPTLNGNGQHALPVSA